MSATEVAVRPKTVADVLETDDAKALLDAGREAGHDARSRRTPGARGSRRMAGAALRQPLIFAAATIAAGVLDSFFPLAKGIPSNLSSTALLVQAIVTTLTRWQAGKYGDRYGHAGGPEHVVSGRRRREREAVQVEQVGEQRDQLEQRERDVGRDHPERDRDDREVHHAARRGEVRQVNGIRSCRATRRAGG